MNAPALLLLHGFTGSPRSFDGVRRAMASRPSELAPWLVGHGNPAAAASVQTFEAELARLADLLPTDRRTLVVGYSLGARLALGLAVRHPQRLHGCICVSGRDGLANATARQQRRADDASWIELLTTQGLAAFVERWQRGPLFAALSGLPESVLAEQRAERLSHTVAGLAHSLRVTGLAEMPCYAERWQEVELRVELLAGEADPAFCQHAEAIVGKLSRGRLTRVPSASHNLLLERPELVASFIERGLEP